MQARVIQTEGLGGDALLQVAGRTLSVIDRFSPAQKPLPPETELEEVTLEALVDAQPDWDLWIADQNPERREELVVTGPRTLLGYGRLVGVRPVTAAFGPLRVVLGDWTNDLRAVGQYVGVPMLGLAARGAPVTAELSCEVLAPQVPPEHNGADDPLDDLVAVASGRAPAEPAGQRTDDVSGFTLKQLLVLMTVMSVVLALTRLLPRPIAAFVLGLVALFGLVTVHDTRSRPAIVRLAWWLLLAIYLFTAVGAVLGL